jgi:hypothetical protein
MNALNGSSGGSISSNCNNVHAPATITITQAGGFIVTTNSSYAIDGGSVIALTGADVNRIFMVSSGATLTLTNIVIRDGNSPGDDGGAIYNSGTVNISNSKFLSNTAGAPWSGGAIRTSGPLNISNSEFAYNRAGNGGVLFPRESTSFTTISGSSFHDNLVTNATNGWGGTMLVWNGAQVNINSTSIVDNLARQGGAIYLTS